MSAVAILDRAEDMLFEGGWSPDARRGVEGPRCPFWALTDAAKFELDGRVRIAAHTAFRLAIGGADVTVWNGVPGRTFGDVVDAFELAKKIAEEREV